MEAKALRVSSKTTVFDLLQTLVDKFAFLSGWIGAAEMCDLYEVWIPEGKFGKHKKKSETIEVFRNNMGVVHQKIKFSFFFLSLLSFLSFFVDFFLVSSFAWRSAQVTADEQERLLGRTERPLVMMLSWSPDLMRQTMSAAAPHSPELTLGSVFLEDK